MLFFTHVNHVRVSPANGIGPTQGQRKSLTRVGIFNSHNLLPSDLVAQLVQSSSDLTRRSWVQFPTLVRVFLCPWVRQFPLVGLMLTWFTWVENSTSHHPLIVKKTGHQARLGDITCSFWVTIINVGNDREKFKENLATTSATKESVEYANHT